MKRSLLSTVVMMSALFMLSACGGGQTNGFVTAPSDGSGSGGSGGTVQSTGIYVSVVSKDQPVTTYLHQFYNFNLPCMISSPGTTASTDMQCLLNVQELDLFEQGLKLELNVPAGVCDYVSDIPYSFYNRRAGHGPSAIDIKIDDNSPGTNTCTITKSTGGTVAGVISGHSCSWPGGSATADGSVTCAYDYTKSNGPNCCAGTYSFNGSLTTAGATSASSVTNVGLSWGGSNGLCLAGPYLDSTSGWKFNAKTGAPYEQIRPAKTNGFNQYYTIRAPITLAATDNTYAANFWDWTSYAAGSLSAAALPTAMKNNPDLMSVATDYTPHTSYEFNCYDAAMEVKHRIRIYINEWDTIAAFQAYGVAGAVTNSPVATGTCDITSGACDDVPGWSQYPAAYPNNDLSSRQ